jgi:hypothetical protein
MRLEFRNMDQINFREQYFLHLLTNPKDIQGLNDIKLQILQMSPNPQYLYKYCSIGTALKILESGFIKLQSADNFNDPFDCLSSVSVWNQDVQFPPSQNELIAVNEIMTHLPAKFQLPYSVFPDLRTSYYYAISCFTPDYKNMLMWSHYANNHIAVCLEFDITGLIEQLHPVFYTKKMPLMDWKSDNLNLTLIKSSAWNYENEWRYVKKTIRPKMRIFGSAAYQIYNQVHSSGHFTQQDKEEWGFVNDEMMKNLDQTYQDESQLVARPTRIFSGINFGHNFTNTNTAEIISKIEDIAKSHTIPIYRIRAEHNSFALTETLVKNLTEYNNPLS